MFTDTITVTINAQAKALVRINQDQYSSEYRLRETDGEYNLRLRNTTYTDKTRGVQVDRHNIELVHNVYPTTAGALGVVRKAYAVFENDRTDPITNPVNHTVGMAAFMTSANLTKLANFES